MNSDDKEQDFIDKIIDLGQIYRKQGVRFLAILIALIMCFIVGFILAPTLIKFCTGKFPFTVSIMQISPAEILFNYLKIAVFFSLFWVSPFYIYQFGKLAIPKDSQEAKLNLLLSSLILFFILIITSYLTCAFIFPTEIMLLYGLNFQIATFTTSLSSIVTSFIFTLLLAILIVLLPILKFLIKKSMFFNYATFVKNRKMAIVYCAVIAGLIALPLEIFVIGVIFLVLFLWYKTLIHFAKKRN